MMNPASRELLGNDRSTSETGRGPDEATDEAQFRNVVRFLGRPTTSDRRVDAMGQEATFSWPSRLLFLRHGWKGHQTIDAQSMR